MSIAQKIVGYLQGIFGMTVAAAKAITFTGTISAPQFTATGATTQAEFQIGSNSGIASRGNGYLNLWAGAEVGGVYIASSIPKWGVPSNGRLGFLSNTTLVTTDSLDTYFTRLAAGVFGTNSWIQNSAGEAALASNFTNATATLNNTNLSLTVIAGRSYRITGMLQVSNSTTTEGIQLDFNGGSATATTFFVAANAIGSVTPGTLTSTTLAGVINYSVITGTDYIMLSGYLKVANGGTLILRFAENTSTLGTATLGAGSWISLNDTVNL